MGRDAHPKDHGVCFRMLRNFLCDKYLAIVMLNLLLSRL